jgi:signal transduction histidine kinase
MRPRTASRLAWCVGIVSIVLLIGAIVLMFVDRHAAIPDGSSGEWTFSNVLNQLVNIAVPAIGIVLASRRPENPIGWLFLVAGLTLGLEAFGTSYGLHALIVNPGSFPGGSALAWAAGWVGVIPVMALAFLFLLFPTGHLPSRRWRTVGWLTGGIFALVLVVLLVASTMRWADPYNQVTPGPGLLFLVLVLVFPIVVVLGAALAAVVVRFRRSVGDERLQLKWFVTGATLVVVTTVVGFFTAESTVMSVLQSVAFVFLWAAVGIAVLKYRLYEIDVVINKAVVYGTVAAFITLVYVGLVIGVGTLAGSKGTPLLSAAAAAVVAVAFQPVRQWAGRLANRVVYGKRATPYEVLSEFAERIGGTYAAEDVLPQMARIIAAGTGADRAVVWLRVGNELRAEASSDGVPEPSIIPAERSPPSWPVGEVAVPVTHGGELLGSISLRMPRGEPLSPAGERLVTDVASQAGLVLANVRLIEELRASRQRIVSAQDQARRRLERNIHDGAQQQLVAIAVKLNVTRSTARKDIEAADAMLEQLQGEATDALETLRDLARGIYPPLLADQGLVAALEAQARKSSVPVSVDADGIGRFSQDAEAAIYFCALEALQNVVKYAQASRATVALAQEGNCLTFTVRDDGVGFDIHAPNHGSGIQGMADRLAALGGELAVKSAPGEGTLVEGRLPIDVST